MSRAQRLGHSLKRFLDTEASGGVLIMGAAVLALIWANSPSADTYDAFWSKTIAVGGSNGISQDLRHWINEGLMAVFFFVVVLEIKRELLVGELKELRVALLPIGLALGGMIVPASIYAAINAGGPGERGWGIPMATDIAFAVAVLALVGSRAPAPLRILLLSLAIVDDLGAIVVIAVFYSQGIDWWWVAVAIGVLSLTVAFRSIGFRLPWIYVPFGLALWFAMYRSGLHPTLAGVCLAATVPLSGTKGEPFLERLEHAIHPYSSFLILPLFALANSGIYLGRGQIAGAFDSRIAMGVLLGLFLGKTLGIVVAAKLLTALHLVRLPESITFRHLVSLGSLAGIGFTVSLFIANLSMKGELLVQASLGIFAGSVVSAMMGVGLLAIGDRQPDKALSQPR